MNLRKASTYLRRLSFAAWHGTVSLLPGGSIQAFGSEEGKIGAIVVINLDRQPSRFRRVIDELSRFRTADGKSLTSLVRRFSAIDARDGRAVAATSDVDPVYRMADQLYVQPDARLEACFGPDEPIRMTRQEVAIARSHIEVWKAVISGPENFVLILEDDVWFRPGAGRAIDQGWRAASRWGLVNADEPEMVYFSYADAGGTAERTRVVEGLFKPLRGLWFLSGYVLSRKGAAKLLRAMPIVGPVDTWMNYRLRDLGAFALSSPAILQRPDTGSDNAYSVLPYLARAGIVDAGSGILPENRADIGRVLAWAEHGERQWLAMALSMLGLRVCVFDDADDPIGPEQLVGLLEVFDALVNPPLRPDALVSASAKPDVKFVIESPSVMHEKCLSGLSAPTVTVLAEGEHQERSWQPLCAALGLPEPIDAFPVGAPRTTRLFRDGRLHGSNRELNATDRREVRRDESPWVLPHSTRWGPRRSVGRQAQKPNVYGTGRTKIMPAMELLTETFPGNLAEFSSEGLTNRDGGFDLVLSETQTATRHYRSGAFATAQGFHYGRFEAEIKAAPGPGLITGFFLHRDMPRQEIDVELAGNDPRRMLVNVFFNPGDEGAAMKFGYRGSPCRVDLNFDSTQDFHLYSIEWGPDRIRWYVDGRVVHERGSWDPTPIPHLAMRLYGNLWAPRSAELVGLIDRTRLPSGASFRNVTCALRESDARICSEMESA